MFFRLKKAHENAKLHFFAVLLHRNYTLFKKNAQRGDRFEEKNVLYQRLKACKWN